MKPGTRFGDYVLHRPLGQGGMADVFLAQRIGASQLCVLKRVRADLSPAVQARMIREANAGTYLEHPNVIRTLDAGTVDGAFFIAVELIVGTDLGALVKRRFDAKEGVPLPILVAVALGVLDGLAHAHEAVDPEGKPLGIVHRDISPNNVMVGRDGSIKVIDFGLVRADVGDFQTRAGMLMGTPQYLSPEQAAGERVDRRADLYSLSVVLHEIIARRTVVPRRNDLMSMVREVISVRLPSIASVDPSIPPGMAAAIDKGLAKDPDERFSDAAAYAARIRAAAGALAAPPAEVRAFVTATCPEVDDFFVETQQLTASIGPVDDQVHAPTMGEVARPRPRSSLPLPSPPVRRRTPPVLVVAAVALALSAAGVIVATSSRPDKHQVELVRPTDRWPAAAEPKATPGIVPLPPPPVAEKPARRTSPTPRRKKTRPRRVARTRQRRAAARTVEPEAPPPPAKSTDGALRAKLERLQNRAIRISKLIDSDELNELQSDITMEAAKREDVPIDAASVASFERQVRAFEAQAER